LLHEKSSNKRDFSAAEKIKKHGSDRAEGFQRAIADFVCFHCPLVASAEAKPLRSGKSSYGRKTSSSVAPIWRDTA
jgi:hypothetical protein